MGFRPILLHIKDGSNAWIIASATETSLNMLLEHISLSPGESTKVLQMGVGGGGGTLSLALKEEKRGLAILVEGRGLVLRDRKALSRGT